MAYEILPHTADIGLEARAPDLPGLFSEATRGLAAIILDDDPPSSDRTEEITVDGADIEDLLVNFLEECLYRYESRGELVVAADLANVSPTRAQGQIRVVLEPDAGGPVIKAVTYHGLAVQRAANGWMARIYLDV